MGVTGTHQRDVPVRAWSATPLHPAAIRGASCRRRRRGARRDRSASRRRRAGRRIRGQVGGQRGHVLRILPGVSRRPVQQSSARNASRSQCRRGAAGSPSASITSKRQAALAYWWCADEERLARRARACGACRASIEAAPPPKREVAAVAHFDEDHVSVAPSVSEHDQVEFADSDSSRSPQPRAARLPVGGASGGFNRVAAGSAVGRLVHKPRHGVSGARRPPAAPATPPLKVDHAGVRCTLPKPSMRSTPVAPLMPLARGGQAVPGRR